MKLLDRSPHRSEAALEKPVNTKRRPPRREELQSFIMGAPRMSSLGTFQSPASEYTHKPFIRTAQSEAEGALYGYTATHPARPVGGALKRCFDCAIALSAIIVMSPIMIAIALLILVTMGRPVIFIQQRVGFNKSLFGCFKFRTMVADAQERLARHLAEDSEAARLWQETQKLKQDPRITWLGHILRKSSLDELPQLFNILFGDMSCIGPRPVLASELNRYGPYAEEYAKAKPGLTGMWQVNGRSNTTYDHRVNCDRYYVRRWSLLLDVVILCRTIPAVLRTKDTA
jgi:exopolysaccharide production protein ExoY